jgi:hypothetical protein
MPVLKGSLFSHKAVHVVHSRNEDMRPMASKAKCKFSKKSPFSVERTLLFFGIEQLAMVYRTIIDFKVNRM